MKLRICYQRTAEGFTWSLVNPENKRVIAVSPQPYQTANGMIQDIVEVVKIIQSDDFEVEAVPRKPRKKKQRV